MGSRGASSGITNRIGNPQSAAYKEAVDMGRSYGMTDDEIGGMRAGIKAKIDLQEKAVARMQSARAEYEKYKKQAYIGNEKAKRRKGKRM